jgi:hypothetical protein
MFDPIVPYPNLAERFPVGLAWARRHASTNDWFVAGDSGAGYLNPGYLTPPRPHSGLESGLSAWERHCAVFYRRWDLDVTGFVIDGFARGLDSSGLDAYARFSPGGIVAQKVPRQGMHGDMPYLRMSADLPGDPVEAARVMRSLVAGPRPRFAVCRSILQSPSWYARVSGELERSRGPEVRVVDLPALLWLVRDYETRRELHVDTRFRDVAAVQARPGAGEGLEPIHVEDGPVETIPAEGVPGWRVGSTPRSRYLYFDADDEFCRSGRGRYTITIEYLDRGRGRIGLQYDSSDAGAPLDGAYKSAGSGVQRAGSAAWREAVWSIEDARFEARQNGGADFRFHGDGDPWWVRRVVLAKTRSITAPAARDP